MKTYKLYKFCIRKTGVIVGRNTKGELWVEFWLRGKLKNVQFIVQEMPAWVEEFELREELGMH